MSEPVYKQNEKNESAPKQNNFNRFGSSMIAAEIELLLFHPPDTIDKRLQVNDKKILGSGISFKESLNNFQKVAFHDTYNKNYTDKIVSVYKGLGWGALYKIPQRMIKFGGQPIVKDMLDGKIDKQFKNYFGEKNGKVMLEATAGASVGALEVALLPLDKLKIINQVNNKKMGIYNALKIMCTNPYKGLSATLARNIPGSFALFSGSAIAKEHILHLDDGKKATFAQSLASSSIGGFLSVIITNPFEVIKTRIQKEKNLISTFTMFKNILQKEGSSAFFKGTGIRALSTVPRFALTMSLAETLPILWSRYKTKKQKEADEKNKLENNMTNLHVCR